MDVDGGPLGLLSTEIDRQAVRMHYNRRWNDTSCKWNGFEAADADRRESDSSESGV